MAKRGSVTVTISLRGEKQTFAVPDATVSEVAGVIQGALEWMTEEQPQAKQVQS